MTSHTLHTQLLLAIRTKSMALLQYQNACRYAQNNKEKIETTKQNYFRAVKAYETLMQQQAHQYAEE